MRLAELEQARLAWTRMSRSLTERRKAGKRTCSKCKKLYGPDGFYGRPSANHSWCKPCENECRRAWRAANPERDREASRRSAAKRRAKAKAT